MADDDSIWHLHQLQYLSWRSQQCNFQRRPLHQPGTVRQLTLYCHRHRQCLRVTWTLYCWPEAIPHNNFFSCAVNVVILTISLWHYATEISLLIVTLMMVMWWWWWCCLYIISTHITPILKSLHWLKVNERIEYKLPSLTYKVLTTAQPSYLRNLISLQPPRSTRFSSVVTLSRPPTISSLKITDRSFRYASPRLWNQLPDSFRQPHHSRLDSPFHPLLNSSLSSSTLLSSITSSLFHSRLKTYLFNKSFPP